MSDTRQDLKGPMETDDIADDAVTTVKIPSGAIKSDEIAAAAVTTVDMADSAITTPKISGGAVTQVKAPFAVDGFQDNQYLKEGIASGLATDVKGTQTLTVTLPSSYGSSLDGVLAFGEDLTDTTAEVDNVRIPDGGINLSGFNISASIKASGVTGSDASFRYIAWGRD